MLLLQVEQLDDPVLPVGEIVRRCPAKQLMALYKVAAFEGAEQFLQHVAHARGKLKKGGTVDVQVRTRPVAGLGWVGGVARVRLVARVCVCEGWVSMGAFM